MTDRYGTSRGSVSGSFKAWRFDYRRTGHADEYAAVIYARTRAEAERKFQKKYVGECTDTEIVRTWRLDDK